MAGLLNLDEIKGIGEEFQTNNQSAVEEEILVLLTPNQYSLIEKLLNKLCLATNVVTKEIKVKGKTKEEKVTTYYVTERQVKSIEVIDRIVQTKMKKGSIVTYKTENPMQIQTAYPDRRVEFWDIALTQTEDNITVTAITETTYAITLSSSKRKMEVKNIRPKAEADAK